MNLPDRHEARTPGGQDRLPKTPEERAEHERLVKLIIQSGNISTNTDKNAQATKNDTANSNQQK